MKQVLKRSRAIRGLRDDLREIRNTSFSGQKAEVSRYLRQTSAPRLHLGANQSPLPGWFDTDIEPIKGVCHYLDATKAFPFPNSSLHFVYAEHMIEHIPRRAGGAMLAECRRVLRRGGVLRVATPDLSFIVGLYSSPSDAGRAYMSWIANRFLRDSKQNDPASVLNNAFRAWGHQFLYDGPTLEAALARAGFDKIERVKYGESSHDDLRNIEQHGKNVENEDMARLETMIFEAS